MHVDHRVSAHAALLSLACRHPPNAGEPFRITHSGRHGARGSGHPVRARACARVATYLPGSQTYAAATTPGSGGTKIFTN